MKSRYRDFVYNTKKIFYKKLKKKRPPYYDEAVWASWIAHWESEKALKAFERGKKNRGSAARLGFKHMTGSIGFSDHHARMKKKYGPQLKFTEVFASTHSTTNEHGTQWVDGRAEQTFELYRTTVGPEVEDASELPWEPSVWANVATQGRKKRGQRLYKFGNYGTAVIFLPEEVSECTATSSQVHSTPPPPPEVVELRERVQQTESLCQELRSENIIIKEKLDTIISALNSSSASTAPFHGS